MIVTENVLLPESWRRVPQGKGIRVLRKPCFSLSTLALVSAFLLSSCGMVQRTKSLFGGTLPIQVTVAPDVNENSPVAVELVVVTNKKLLDKLLEKSAQDWFAGREQFKRDFPKGYQSWFWEWVPGQDVAPVSVSIPSGAKAGVLFADYYSPGQHRARIDPRKPLRILFGEKNFTIEEPL